MITRKERKERRNFRGKNREHKIKVKKRLATATKTSDRKWEVGVDEEKTRERSREGEEEKKVEKKEIASEQEEIHKNHKKSQGKWAQKPASKLASIGALDSPPHCCLNVHRSRLGEVLVLAELVWDKAEIETSKRPGVSKVNKRGDMSGKW